MKKEKFLQSGIITWGNMHNSVFLQAGKYISHLTIKGWFINTLNIIIWGHLKMVPKYHKISQNENEKKSLLKMMLKMTFINIRVKWFYRWI